MGRDTRGGTAERRKFLRTRSNSSTYLHWEIEESWVILCAVIFLYVPVLHSISDAFEYFSDHIIFLSRSLHFPHTFLLLSDFSLSLTLSLTLSLFLYPSLNPGNVWWNWKSATADIGSSAALNITERSENSLWADLHLTSAPTTSSVSYCT